MEATNFGPENLTSGTTNDATIQHGVSHHTSFTIFYICISIVTFIVGFIGNGLVIFLTGCRMKTTVNSIWFLNLAIADFLFILSFIIIDIIPYLVPYHFMEFVHMTKALNMFASIFSLVVISLDRCLCTWMPVWAQNNRTVCRARIICMIVWILSICCCIPSFNSHVLHYTFLVTYEFLVGFVIPFMIIASSHIAIGVRIKRLKIGKQLRSYRVIVAVVLAFFICCFPFHVCRFYGIKVVVWNAMRISLYLVHLNSCLNPILYVFMCDEYKKKLKQSLLLVLETAFAEDHLDFRGRQIQKDEQNQTNTFELFESISNDCNNHIISPLQQPL